MDIATGQMVQELLAGGAGQRANISLHEEDTLAMKVARPVCKLSELNTLSQPRKCRMDK